MEFRGYRIAMIVVLLSWSVSAMAQKKPQKPIKLQAKTDNHKVSFETETDIFYFTNTDLIAFFESVMWTKDKKSDKTAAAAVNYLQNYHKEIEYQKGQTKFENAGERSLYQTINTHLKAILLKGKAADVQKEGNKINLFLIIKKCDTDSTKETLTEKKGREVLSCM